MASCEIAEQTFSSRSVCSMNSTGSCRHLLGTDLSEEMEKLQKEMEEDIAFSHSVECQGVFENMVPNVLTVLRVGTNPDLTGTIGGSDLMTLLGEADESCTTQTYLKCEYMGMDQTNNNHTRPTPIPGAYLCSPDSSPENSPASSPWGSPSSSTPHPNMPGVGWFPRQEGSEMTRLPADITSVLAPRPSRATTTADEEDEPSITELCIQNRNIMQARIQLGIAAPITPYVPDPLIQAVAQAANYNAAPVRFAAPTTGGSTAGRGQRYVNTSGSGTNTRAPTRRQIRWAELPDISD